MKTDTENKHDDAPDGGAARDCPVSAGSVARLKETLEMLEATTEAAHFYGQDLESLRKDIGQLVEKYELLQGYAETQRLCKIAAHDRLDDCYDHIFSQNK